MSLDRSGLTESFFAKLALKRSFPSMRSLVTAKARLLIKSFVTNRAEMSFLFRVLFSMKNDGISVGEPAKSLHFVILKCLQRVLTKIIKCYPLYKNL